MHVMSEPLFWVAIVIAAIAVLGFHYIDKRKKQKQAIIKRENIQVVTPDSVENTDDDIDTLPYMDNYTADIPVRMCDNILGQIYDTEISKETAKEITRNYGTLGRRWDRYGKKVYGLVRYHDEKDNNYVKLKPILIQSSISNSPTELFNDLQQPEVKIIISQLANADEKSAFSEVGKYLPWLAALGFLAFLWAFS